MTKLPREYVKRLQDEVVALRESDEPSVMGAGGGLSPMPSVDDLSIVFDFVTEEAGLTVETEADPDQRHHAERALAAANRLRGIVTAPRGARRGMAETPKTARKWGFCTRCHRHQTLGLTTDLCAHCERKEVGSEAVFLVTVVDARTGDVRIEKVTKLESEAMDG